MKKNLISVVIMALVIANLILTAILTISIMPQTKNANELITKVAAAIDLDLEAVSGGGETVPVAMDKMDSYAIADPMTVNLKNAEDGKSSYAVITITIYMNKDNPDYKTYGTAEAMASSEGLIKGEINTILGRYTAEELKADPATAQAEILASLQKLYSSDFIIKVAFPTATYQ
ncbi:flagellar basal body-associated FliL family protein [Lachnospiraceae bacterium ZAX-1]